MVEYVKVDETKQKGLTDKQRTHLIIFTYVFNFMLYVILYDIYENFFLKILTFILICAFASQMLAQQTSISAINGWSVVFLIINIFAFGFGSLILSYNLIVIGINLLYFKYIVKKVDLNPES